MGPAPTLSPPCSVLPLGAGGEKEGVGAAPRGHIPLVLRGRGALIWVRWPASELICMKKGLVQQLLQGCLLPSTPTPSCEIRERKPGPRSLEWTGLWGVQPEASIPGGRAFPGGEQPGPRLRASPLGRKALRAQTHSPILTSGQPGGGRCPSPEHCAHTQLNEQMGGSPDRLL